MAYRRIEVDPLTPAIGAEIQGVDLSRPLDDQTYGEIHDAWMKHLVIFFRDQDLTLDQHKAFGRRFGALHIHPAAPGPKGHPEIFVVHTDKDSTFSEGNGWHSDVSCDAEPPMGSDEGSVSNEWADSKGERLDTLLSRRVCVPCAREIDAQRPR